MVEVGGRREGREIKRERMVSGEGVRKWKRETEDGHKREIRRCGYTERERERGE